MSDAKRSESPDESLSGSSLAPKADVGARSGDLAGDLAGELLPRLGTSKKWTPLPAEFLEKVQQVFAEQFQMEAQDGTFIIEGRIYPEELVLRTGYLEHGRLRQVNFEASMDLKQKKPTSVTDDVAATEESSKIMERLYIGLDALGSVMEEYFDIGEESEDDGIDIPPHWRPYDFEGESIYLQFSTVNSSLEAEADRILGASGVGPALFKEDESEDALHNAEIDSELAEEVQRIIRSGQFPEYLLERPKTKQEKRGSSRFVVAVPVTFDGKKPPSPA